MTKFAACRAPLALALLGASTLPAHAYLDPGTGSMFLQLLLGGVVGIAIAAKLYWYKFLMLFGAKPRSEGPADTVEPAHGAETDSRISQ